LTAVILCSEEIHYTGLELEFYSGSLKNLDRCSVMQNNCIKFLWNWTIQEIKMSIRKQPVNYGIN